MSFNMAKKQFDENLRLFGNINSQPEKFNLYAGLSNLAKALEDLEYEVAQVKREVRNK